MLSNEHMRILELARSIEAEVMQAQPKQEPVAWRWSESKGERWFDWRTSFEFHGDVKEAGFPIEYAYATPPPCPKCGPLENSLEQTSKTLGDWIAKCADLESELSEADTSLKAVEAALKDVQYKGAYAEGVRFLKLRIAFLEAECARLRNMKGESPK